MSRSFKKPPFLEHGSRVMVIAPSGLVEKSRIEAGIGILQAWGFEVIRGKHIYGRSNIYSGTDRERLQDLQKALDSPDISAVFCARGGYGLSRIIEKVDFSGFKKHPKWVVGFSDITVLHSAISNTCRTCSLHAPVLSSFITFDEKDRTLSKLRTVLTGKELAYKGRALKMNRKGTASGILCGGNLSLLYNLRSTKYDLKPEGKILFIEDLGEYYYHLDRMIMNLKNSGVLSEISGLICGGFTEMKDQNISFGKNAEELIYDAVKEYKYPVVFRFPAGHMHPNYPLVIGSNCTLKSTSDNYSLLFD